MQTLKEQLASGLIALNLASSEDTIAKWLDYIALLEKWNQVYNLTAIHGLASMVTYHLLDSLSIASFVQGRTVLDIGTGPGLPGLPLAIYFPDKQFFLLDSRSKKTTFLQQVISSLNLDNVTVINQRVEGYIFPDGFDVIVTRALGQLRAILRLSQHLCRPDTIILAMKGRYPDDELAEIERPLGIYPLTVPGLKGEQRHLVVMKPSKQH